MSRVKRYEPPELCEGVACGPYKVDVVAFVSFFTVLAVAFFLDYLFIISQTGSTWFMAYASQYTVFLLLLLGGGIGTVILIIVSIVKQDNLLTVDTSVDLLELAKTLFFGAVFAGALCIMWLFSSSLPLSYSYEGSTLSQAGSAYMATPQVMQPVAEEWSSRGATYGFMDRVIPGNEPWKMPVKGAPSAGIFTLMHWFAYTFTPGLMVFLFGSGMILAFSYWYTRKLGVPIIAHLIWNLVQLWKAGMI